MPTTARASCAARGGRGEDRARAARASRRRRAPTPRRCAGCTPARTQFELLDKPIVFDDAQDAAYRRPAPLVIVGSAGSGKTAVTLARLREAEGRVLYVTQSAYLAQARARPVRRARLREPGAGGRLPELPRVPRDAARAAGREVDVRRLLRLVRAPPPDAAARWARSTPTRCSRNSAASSAPSPTGPLSLADYLALGARQSLLAADRREAGARAVPALPAVAGRGGAVRPQPGRARMAAAGAKPATTSSSSTRCRTSPPCSSPWCWPR